MAQDFASAHAILEQYRNDLTENLLAAAPKLLQYQLKPSKNIEIHQKETLPMAARTDRGGKS